MLIDKQFSSVVDFNGTWINELNSEMRLEVSNASLSGFYRTNVDRPDKTKEFTLVGFVVGDLIIFNVNFSGSGSHLVWTGQHIENEDGSRHIRTMWNLTKYVPQQGELSDLWASIVAGAQTFCFN